MIINPYLTKINTLILKRLTPHGKVHLALRDRIDLDYEKYQCFKEKFQINESPVENIYDSSLGKVYIIDKKPQANFVKLSVDYDTRIRILKSFTSRYLINSVLNKYLNLSAKDFKTGELSSSFFIEGQIDEDKIKDIIICLQNVISMYIDSALDVNSEMIDNKATCEIYGIYKGEYLYPHLSNLAEIGKFNIVHYELKDRGVNFHYNN